MARFCLALATLLATLALPTALALASPYTEVLKTYETLGAIPPCKYSSPELESALKGVSTFEAQYGADFTDAVRSALTLRAGGRCAARSSLPLIRTARTPPNAAGGPIAGGPLTAATNASLPAPFALLAALAGIVALIAATGAIARLRGWELAPADRWRHAWGEAGYRARSAWGELADRLRSR